MATTAIKPATYVIGLDRYEEMLKEIHNLKRDLADATGRLEVAARRKFKLERDFDTRVAEITTQFGEATAKLKEEFDHERESFTSAVRETLVYCQSGKSLPVETARFLLRAIGWPVGDGVTHPYHDLAIKSGMSISEAEENGRVMILHETYPLNDTIYRDKYAAATAYCLHKNLKPSSGADHHG